MSDLDLHVEKLTQSNAISQFSVIFQTITYYNFYPDVLTFLNLVYFDQESVAPKSSE